MLKVRQGFPSGAQAARSGVPEGYWRRARLSSNVPPGQGHYAQAGCARVHLPKVSLPFPSVGFIFRFALAFLRRIMPYLCALLPSARTRTIVLS